MERLTRRYDTYIAVVCENCDKQLECNGGVICGEVLRNRLAAYEDAMPLERLQELAQAEKDGRIAVLPCKVGDFVFNIQDGEPYATRVLSFSYFGDHWACRTVSSYPDLEEFGERIFLNREEAEAALKKMEDPANGQEEPAE